MASSLLLANAAATWAMVGVIWFVQLVHYPLFAGYAGDGFRLAMAAHQRLTTWVVAPLMLAELVTSLALPAVTPGWLPWAGVACVTVCWASTVAVQVPLHERLARDGYDLAVERRLVRTNWVRTVAWTLHGAVCGWMAALGS